jgi:hypothetical protein
MLSGITEYLDTIQRRRQDINTVRQRVAIFASEITAIEVIEHRLFQSTSSRQPSLLDCTKACEKELQALQHFLATFDDGNILKKWSTKKVLKSRDAALSYPFKRKDLARLEERLDRANGILCANLQAVRM